jgi:hypothetical protein
MKSELKKTLVVMVLKRADLKNIFLVKIIVR